MTATLCFNCITGANKPGNNSRGSLKMTQRVNIVLGSALPGKLMVVEIVGDRFPVLLARPASLIRLFAKEEMADGQIIGTGQREVDGEVKNVAWRADADEIARIDREWREALDRSSYEIV